MNKANFDSGVPVIRINEWNTTILKDVKLKADDRRLVEDLSATNCLEVEELLAGLRVRSKSWIGVIRFSSLEIQIHPKLSGDNIRVIEMIELTQGLDILKQMPGVREIETTGRSLMDLLAMMLLHESERLIRNGLLSDYVQKADELPVLRGRILADRQVLERYGQIDRLICQFDDRSQDIPENQLLAIGTHLCSRFATNEGVRRKARELGHILRQVCNPIGFDVRMGDSQIVYDRMNSTYRDAHQLCWLIIQRCGIKDFFESSTVKSFAFMLDMNRLFEEFVFKVVSQIFDPKAWEVSKQDSRKSIVWNTIKNKSYSSVRPDIVIRNRATGKALTIDSKYKLYDGKKISSSDIYQSFVYAFGYQTQSAGPIPKSLLLFPTSNTGDGEINLEVRGPNRKALANVVAFGIDIPRIIDSLKAGNLKPEAVSFVKHIEEQFDK